MGEKISLHIASSGEGEAAEVINRIRALIGGGTKPEEVAVLYRANFQSRALEEACLASGLPYQVIGTRFFERKEVKDTLSWINAARNPESLSDIKRIINIPPRGIGKVTLAKLFSGEKNKLPLPTQRKIESFYALLKRVERASLEKMPAELLIYILAETGFREMLRLGGDEGKERLENIQELVTLGARYKNMPQESALDKFLEDAALATDQDALLQEGKGVRLMTVHASKGLEFPYVFITGLEDGLFPHTYEGDSEGSSGAAGYGGKERAEEERRLFYVALTRAQRKLFLSCAETRIVFGKLELNAPSEFLADIPQELMEIEYMREEELPAKTILFD